MRFVLLLFLFVQGETLFSQSFQHIYNNGYANNITGTPDGGFIITGSVVTNTNERIFLMKTDSSGNAQWLKSYRDLIEFYSYGSTVINLNEGGFLCTGMSYNDTSSSEEISLIKTDSAGSKIWAKRMGNPVGDDEPSALLQTGNDFLVSGFTTDSAGEDFYLIKTDSSGNILQSKTYGSSRNERGIILLPYNNGFIFGGYGQDSTGENDICLLILDSLFEISSSLRISIPGDQQLNAMCLGADNSLYLAATHQTAVNSPRSLFVKLTPSLALSWSYVLDGNLSEPYSIVNSPQGFTVTGYWARSVFKQNGYILQLDTAGNMSVPIFFGDSTGCALKSVSMHNGDAVAAGYITIDASIHSSIYLNHFSFTDTSACNHFFENAFLLPASATLETLSWNTDTPQTPNVTTAMLVSSVPPVDSFLCDLNALVDEISSGKSFSFYPDPSDEKTTIILPGNTLNAEISLYNLFGELVYRVDSIRSNNELDLKNLSSGIYIIHVRSESVTSSQKIIIQH